MRDLRLPGVLRAPPARSVRRGAAAAGAHRHPVPRQHRGQPRSRPPSPITGSGRDAMRGGGPCRRSAGMADRAAALARGRRRGTELEAARAAIRAGVRDNLQAGNPALRSGDADRATAAMLRVLALDPANARRPRCCATSTGKSSLASRAGRAARASQATAADRGRRPHRSGYRDDPGRCRILRNRAGHRDLPGGRSRRRPARISRVRRRQPAQRRRAAAPRDARLRTVAGGGAEGLRASRR